MKFGGFGEKENESCPAFFTGVTLAKIFTAVAKAKRNRTVLKRDDLNLNRFCFSG